MYKGKTIYYSLGNFIFDQYWSKEVSKGLGVEVLIKNRSLSFKEYYFNILRDGRTCLTNDVIL